MVLDNWSPETKQFLVRRGIQLYMQSIASSEPWLHQCTRHRKLSTPLLPLMALVFRLNQQCCIHPPRCYWSVVMNPRFAELSEQYTEAEFLQVDTEECEVG